MMVDRSRRFLIILQSNITRGDLFTDDVSGEEKSSRGCARGRHGDTSQFRHSRNPVCVFSLYAKAQKSGEDDGTIIIVHDIRR